MGIQYTCAKQVNRIGVITTMVTGTLSSLVSRLVDRSKNTDLPTGVAHVKHEYLYPTETTGIYKDEIEKHGNAITKVWLWE